MGAQAFDLADRLQTPIFVMLDLDIGMQDWLTEPFAWDDARALDRGKVMTAEELEAGKDFGRYLDVDGDGIPYRTLSRARTRRAAPTSRAARRRTATRATPRRGRRTSTTCSGCCASSRRAKALVPGAGDRARRRSRRAPASIWFGSTGAPMAESLAALEAQRHPPRPDAHARVPVRRRGRRVHRRARPRVRRRAEPRRAAARAAGQRMRHRPGEAHLGAALRRQPDDRALHHAARSPRRRALFNVAPLRRSG